MDGLWQVDRSPHVGALRRAAPRMRALPAAAAALRIDPASDPTHTDALLHPCVGVRLVWHPSTAALLEAAGGVQQPLTTFTLKVPGATGQTEPLRDVAERVLPGAWIDANGAPLDAAAVSALFGVPLTFRASELAQRGAGKVAVTRKGRTLTLRLIVEPLEVRLARAHVSITATRSTRLTPTQVPDVVTAIRKAGIVPVDADTADRFADLGWVHDRRLLLTPAPGAPGWVETSTGPLITSALAPVLPAADAVAGARPATGRVALAIDPLVTAAAAGQVAASVPSVIDGVALRSWQEAFVGQYLSNGVGLVNALPPGSGKTACVAGAMAAAHATREPDAPAHRGLVVAPTSLLEQWDTELGVFHPAATVLVCTTEADLPALSAAWDAPGPVVAVCSPGLLAKHPRVFADLGVDDLAVDEATYLRTDSDQTRALWAARTEAKRAAVLTGTPDAGLPGTVEALVSFAAGRRDLMSRTATLSPTLSFLSPVELAGPWVFGQHADLAGALPSADAALTPLMPGPFEQAVTDVATERVKALLAAADTPAKQRRAATALRAELDGWRTGLACPAALMVGRSVLARQVRTRLGAEGLLPADLEAAPPALADLLRAARGAAGTKPAWVCAWVMDGAARGEQSLVFADSVPALETLAAALKDAGVPGVAVLSGKVRPPARARLVEQFTAGTLRTLLIASTGQLGLNLQTASRVAHLDIPPTAAALTQRSARAARMGSQQTRIEVAVPTITGSAEETWWAHTAGAGAPTDILGLATELTTAAKGRRRR